ncbi:hypothetical protein AND_010054 [Anopheles darlingi]|uniref:Uncharacterized protein n=1 Tax=Anopheles darlingi TaxID=43151 RepID=W5J3J1_ANODA|nr:hypothetical protein AND_010054 [Anopheles darlingi]
MWCRRAAAIDLFIISSTDPAPQLSGGGGVACGSNRDHHPHHHQLFHPHVSGLMRSQALKAHELLLDRSKY